MRISTPLLSIANQHENNALVIERFLELDDWKILEITDEIPFDTQIACPTDGNKLNPVCILTSNKNTQTVRIGSCALCGYAGYMDRPTKEWMRRFYADKWDGGLSVNIEADVAARREQFLRQGADITKQKRVTQLLTFLKRCPISKNRPVLEIGCGYGIGLTLFQKLGFKQIYGVENSRHRAEIASRAYGITAYTGAFEDTSVQQACRAAGPFGLIVSHHVMEHVYDPQEIIRCAADMQEEGDYLIVSLPNQTGEPSMMTLLFLPHLHSFTKESFACLLERNGYTLLDDMFTRKKEIFFLARKGKSKGITYPPAEMPSNYSIKKFTQSLGFEKNHISQSRRLWWYRPLGLDRGGQLPFFGNTMIDNTFYRMRLHADRLIRKKVSPVTQSCLVRDVNKRRIPASECPLEIQFEKNILVAYK